MTSSEFMRAFWDDFDWGVKDDKRPISADAQGLAGGEADQPTPMPELNFTDSGRG